MVKYFYYIMIVFLLSFASCSGMQHVTESETAAAIPEKPAVDSASFSNAKMPVFIMGKGTADSDKLSRFLLQNNPQANPAFVRSLAAYYIEEAAYEGVNHDVAFAQMCLETGYLRFGNLVTPDQNNFAGLGATGLPLQDGTLDKGLYFPDPRTGVRGHIQHLKAYASTEPLNLELVNPRRRFVRLGCSPTIDGLAGTWAADRQYAVKINTILLRLYEFELI